MTEVTERLSLGEQAPASPRTRPARPRGPASPTPQGRCHPRPAAEPPPPLAATAEAPHPAGHAAAQRDRGPAAGASGIGAPREPERPAQLARGPDDGGAPEGSSRALHYRPPPPGAAAPAYKSPQAWAPCRPSVAFPAVGTVFLLSSLRPPCCNTSPGGRGQVAHRSRVRSWAILVPLSPEAGCHPLGQGHQREALRTVGLGDTWLRPRPGGLWTHDREEDSPRAAGAPCGALGAGRVHRAQMPTQHISRRGCQALGVLGAARCGPQGGGPAARPPVGDEHGPSLGWSQASATPPPRGAWPL